MSSSPNLIQVGAVVDLSQYKAGMAEAAATTQAATQEMARGFAEAGEAAELNMSKAKGAMALVSEEIGVTIPRHLRSFIAEMPGVGQALTVAFSGIAVIALGELILRIGEKVIAFKSQLNELSEAEKSYHDKIVADAKEELGFLERKIKAEYAVQIAKAGGDELAQQELRLEMYTALVGVSEKYIQKLKEEQQSLIKTAESHALSSMIAASGESAQTAMAKEQAAQRAEAYRREAQARQRAIDEAGFALKHAEAAQIDSQMKIGEMQLRALTEEQNRLDALARKWKEYADKIINENKRAYETLNKDSFRLQEESFRHDQEAADKEVKEAIAGIDRKNKAFLKAANDRRTAAEEANKGEIEDARQDEQIQEQLIQQQFLKGQITRQQEIAALSKAKQDELQTEIAFLKQRETLWAGDAKKIQEIENQITKAVKQSALDQAKAVTESLKAELQQYQQMLGQINSALADFVTTGKFNWQQMIDSMISDMVKMGLQWVETQIMMKILGMQTSKETAGSNIMDSAASGAAAAGASVAAIPVIGWSMVEAVSAETYASLAAFNAGIAAFELGGIVPATGLAKVHAGETILPASMSGDGKGLSSGLSVHFHVHAVDGEDGAAFIQKKMPQITDNLMKQLKRKGFFSK